MEKTLKEVEERDAIIIQMCKKYSIDGDLLKWDNGFVNSVVDHFISAGWLSSTQVYYMTHGKALRDESEPKINLELSNETTNASYQSGFIPLWETQCYMSSSTEG